MTNDAVILITESAIFNQMLDVYSCLQNVLPIPRLSSEHSAVWRKMYILFLWHAPFVQPSYLQFYEKYITLNRNNKSNGLSLPFRDIRGAILWFCFAKSRKDVSLRNLLKLQVHFLLRNGKAPAQPLGMHWISPVPRTRCTHSFDFVWNNSHGILGITALGIATNVQCYFNNTYTNVNSKSLINQGHATIHPF